MVALKANVDVWIVVWKYAQEHEGLSCWTQNIITYKTCISRVMSTEEQWHKLFHKLNRLLEVSQNVHLFKIQSEKKSFGILPQSFFESQIFKLLIHQGNMTECTHSTSCSVQNHYLFRLSSSCPRSGTARRNDPERGGRERERSQHF